MRGTLKGIMEGCDVADRNLADASAAVMTSFIAERRRGKRSGAEGAKEKTLAQGNRRVLIGREESHQGWAKGLPVVGIPIPVTSVSPTLLITVVPTTTTRTLQRQ
ncbi:unnamed protein product [Linum trigynum]|uniref:Uncharacterized protein n=1 Tax=Linum trigynum TaxID=586398 RepID=A0AAV2EFE0_9ROSI